MCLLSVISSWVHVQEQTIRTNYQRTSFGWGEFHRPVQTGTSRSQIETEFVSMYQEQNINRQFVSSAIPTKFKALSTLAQSLNRNRRQLATLSLPSMILVRISSGF